MEPACSCLPDVRGAALLDPAVAQHTRVIRTPGLLNDEEVQLCHMAAAVHKAEHIGCVKSNATEGSSDVLGKLYLHHVCVPDSLVPLVRKIYEHVKSVDADHWGLLADSEVAADGPMMARCVEYHEYATDERQYCASHYDAGSLFTADVMLSDVGEFSGGTMQTTSVDASGKESVTSHTFERGDCLVFLSHKAHSVTRILTGRRRVLVIEFWQGGRCVANHRCCDGGSGFDPLCGNREGSATYYSRYARPEPVAAAHAPVDLSSDSIQNADATAKRLESIVQVQALARRLLARPTVRWLRALGNYCAADGPPYLRSSSSVGSSLLWLSQPPAAARAAMLASAPFTPPPLLAFSQSSAGGRSAFSFVDSISDDPRGHERLAVWVEWGALPACSALRSLFTLSLRHRGAVVSTATSCTRQVLCTSVSTSSYAPGSDLVAELKWAGGTRHLHVHTPLHALDLRGLVGTGALWARLRPDLPRMNSSSMLASLAPERWRSPRGFGIELEMSTDERDDACGGAIVGGSSLTEQLRERLMQCIDDHCAHNGANNGGEAEGALPAEQLRSRCRLWTVSTDALIEGVSAWLAQDTLAQEYPLSGGQEPTCTLPASQREKAMRMLMLADGTHRSEFKSPPPPHELRFTRGAAAEIRAFMGSVARMGSATPSITSRCRAGTSVHCHVNINNVAAGGEQLSAEGVLNVWFGWVRFDLVTASLARPWAWRDSSSVPLYATGAEGRASEAAWVQGETRGRRVGGGSDEEWARPPRLPTTCEGASSLEAIQLMLDQINASIEEVTASTPTVGSRPQVSKEYRAGGASGGSDASGRQPSSDHLPSRLQRTMGLDGFRWNGTRRVPMEADVVCFHAHVHTLWRSRGFGQLSEQSKCRALFGEEDPDQTQPSAVHLGRYCSLNLQRLCSYGTLEFRRFHGTLNAVAVTEWARFCVAFVDVFRHIDSCATFLDQPLAKGLAALQLAQEGATLAELAGLMGDHLPSEYMD